MLKEGEVLSMKEAKEICYSFVIIYLFSLLSTRFFY